MFRVFRIALHQRKSQIKKVCFIYLRLLVCIPFSILIFEYWVYTICFYSANTTDGIKHIPAKVLEYQTVPGSLTTGNFSSSSQVVNHFCLFCMLLFWCLDHAFAWCCRIFYCKSEKRTRIKPVQYYGFALVDNLMIDLNSLFLGFLSFSAWTFATRTW